MEEAICFIWVISHPMVWVAIHQLGNQHVFIAGMDKPARFFMETIETMAFVSISSIISWMLVASWK